MQSIKIRGNLILVVLASLLSGFNGVLSIGLVMVFSGHEGLLSWVAIYAPVSLFIVAACSYRFPRKGLLIYAALLITSILLCVGPTNRTRAGVAHWLACTYNLRFAVLGCGLLIINAAVTRLNRTGECATDVEQS